MDRFQPKPEDLPTEFAVFPLTGALMLPRGKLPLNIFEPRYLAMTLDSLAAGRMFGMVQPDSNAPKTLEGPGQVGSGQAEPGQEGPGLYRIGCLGRVSSFSETDDGRLLITLTGLTRFSIVSELEMRNGYRRVRGDFSRFAADLGEPQPALFDREAILAALRTYFARRAVEANWDAIKRMDDDMLVITLAMACPFEPVEKQALLEAQTGADRADTLLALLQMGAAGPEGTSGHSVS